MTDELTPQQAAAYMVMQGFHDFAVSCINLFGPDHPVSLLARRNAQRQRYQLIVGEDPGEAEVRDQITRLILERRERIAALTTR